ncbi:hypothetical protein FCJ60_22830 [Burkholderia metallica]|nr:hypothetical protein [Burkholderia metallica]
MIVMAAGAAALMSPSAYGGSGSLSQGTGGTGGSGAGARIVVDPASRPDLRPPPIPSFSPRSACNKPSIPVLKARHVKLSPRVVRRPHPPSIASRVPSGRPRPME